MQVSSRLAVYTPDIYRLRRWKFGNMSKSGTAKLFRNGRSQAVRLPREFRFAGDQVHIRRVADGILLQPIVQSSAEWFAKMDELNTERFLSDRQQPITPKRKIFR